MNQIVIAKFLFQEDWNVLGEALSLDPSFHAEEFTSANDLATAMSTNDATLILASIRSKEDLIQLATLIKNIKKVGISSCLKITVVNFVHEKVVEKAISKLGIIDILDDRITTKALKFKLDFWMKSLAAQTSKNQKQTSLGLKTIERNKDSTKKNESQLPHWNDALDLSDDIWLLRNDSDCKRILTRWLIKLTGPGPYAGSWVETEVNSNRWRFEIKPEFQLELTPGSGIWYFSGEQKPEFIWKENIWLVTGEEFELYCEVANVKYSRFSLHEKTLNLARNSTFAHNKEQIILDSFNREMVIQHQKEGDHLRGKSQTEHLTIEELSGTISEKEKSRNGDLGITLDAHYESSYKGATHEEDLKSDPLSGKSHTESLKTHYEYHPVKESNVVQVDFGQKNVSRIFDEVDLELEESTQEAFVISFLEQNNLIFDSKLDDYFDHSILFHTKHSGLLANQTVRMNLSFLYKGETKKVALDGILTSLDSDEEGSFFVEVHIGVEGSKAFEVFMDMYRNRQQNVDYFIKRTKGF